MTHKMSHRSSYKQKEAIVLPTPTSASSISQLPSLLKPLTNQVEGGAMECVYTGDFIINILFFNLSAWGKTPCDL